MEEGAFGQMVGAYLGADQQEAAAAAAVLRVAWPWETWPLPADAAAARRAVDDVRASLAAPPVSAGQWALVMAGPVGWGVLAARGELGEVVTALPRVYAGAAPPPKLPAVGVGVGAGVLLAAAVAAVVFLRK